MRFPIELVALGLLAQSAFSWAAGNDPDQIRLAFIPSGMCVSWTTESALSSPPQVRYGLTANSMTSTASGTSHSYGTATFHDVLLNGLNPYTLYFYQITADASSTSSAILNFTTAPTPGDERSFTVTVVGDMGLANAADTLSAITDLVEDSDFYVHIGDLSYADDYYLRSGDTYEGSWTEWQDEMEPITSLKPYMSLPGNHEVTCSEVSPFLCPEGQRNMTAYKHRFRMPGEESGGTGNLWFSYDFGQIHFIHLNMETDFPNAPSGPGSWLNGGGEPGQIEWLEADLIKAASNRQQVPWIIALGHRPLYSSGGACGACVDAFEALFNKYNVDVYFAGHIHWYERLYAISPGGNVVNTDYNNPTAPVYIVNGAAGNVEGHSTGSQQDYTALIDDSDYGYGRLTLTNRSALTWQFFRSSDRSLADQITLVKEH